MVENQQKGKTASKKDDFSWKKLLNLFANSKSCLTFALAFGKQRGNAFGWPGSTIDPWQHSITDKQYNLAWFFIKQEA